ncbi:bud site selection protein [Dispira parvispora]|uniref:Bud site selection protein n=1 Tax=Dispira parvispora TaxID=1520584 RepID=A0A9W8AUD2_9FUNG|nr:bud site selection protein [Dispira parvispora]
MAETFRDVPEFFEVENGESISVRTESLAAFRDLGPPDLCHVTKINSAAKSSSTRDLGSYHNVLGVDASSSASLAAYINSLTYAVDDPQGWFGKSAGWRISSGTYCCYNTFSHLDVRVEVKIPGGVESYAVTPRGERLETTPQIWQQCHVSAMLRAILYTEEEGYRLHALRRVYPITSLAMEQKFLESCQALFWQAWQLGSSSKVQMTTTIHNYLNDGLIKYFGDNGRYEVAAKFYESLYPRDPEVGALLAKCYFGANLEVKGVRLLHEALEKSPSSYPLLHAQVDFLENKKKFNPAIQLAKFAVKNAPSEFLAWAKLTKVYVEADRYELALLTLNSCPMFTFTDKDYPRMPQPARIHLPSKADLSNLMDLSDYENKTNDPSESYLLRLPAPGLRGTFAKAYEFLCILVKKVGWDELLRLRSSVFVMEDEYRQQKAREESIHSPPISTTVDATHSVPETVSAQPDSHDQPRAVATEAGHTRTSSEGKPATLSESAIAGMENLHIGNSTPSPSQEPEVPQANGNTESSKVEDTQEKHHTGRHSSASSDSANDDVFQDVDMSGVPSAQVECASSPVDDDIQSLQSVNLEDSVTNAQQQPAKTETELGPGSEVWSESSLSPPRNNQEPSTTVRDVVDADTVKTPLAALTDKKSPSVEEVEEETTKVVVLPTDSHTGEQSDQAQEKSISEKQPPQATATTHREPPGLVDHKRLCERWLDNLFMVLYEDLRAYIDCMSEIYRSQTNPHASFRHTAAEWEALGDLAWRLLYKSEAKEAYIHSVQQRFSPRSWYQLLAIYTEEGNLQMALNAVVQLAIYQERWYNEMVYPSPLASNVVKLVQEHGLSKIQNVLISMNLASPLQKLVTRYFAFVQAFQIEGYDW